LDGVEGDEVAAVEEINKTETSAQAAPPVVPVVATSVVDEAAELPLPPVFMKPPSLPVPLPTGRPPILTTTAAPPPPPLLPSAVRPSPPGGGGGASTDANVVIPPALPPHPVVSMQPDINSTINYNSNMSETEEVGVVLKQPSTPLPRPPSGLAHVRTGVDDGAVVTAATTTYRHGSITVTGSAGAATDDDREASSAVPEDNKPLLVRPPSTPVPRPPSIAASRSTSTATTASTAASMSPPYQPPSPCNYGASMTLHTGTSTSTTQQLEVVEETSMNDDGDDDVVEEEEEEDDVAAADTNNISKSNVSTDGISKGLFHTVDSVKQMILKVSIEVEVLHREYERLYYFFELVAYTGVVLF
jgi:hypothetical protein